MKRAWPRYILGGLILLRATLAAAFFGSAMAWKLGLPNPVSGHQAEILAAMPDWILLSWGVYVAGYALAGLLVLRGRLAALPVYALAFLIDAAIWVRSAFDMHYQAALGGRANDLDMVFNAVDLGLLTAIIIAWRLNWLRWQARHGFSSRS